MMRDGRPNGGREPVARLAAMPRPPLFLLSVALGAVIAVALASCGSDDEGTIPPEDAAVMLTALENARGEQEQGDCSGISDAAGNLLTEINEAPETVDPEVRQGIVEGANNLRTLAETRCEPTGPTGPSGPDSDEETTPPSETTPAPETTPTPDEDEDEEPPPEQPDNEGGGNLGQGNQGGRPPSQGEGQGPPSGGGEPPPETGGTGGGISP
jgi:hypothetical protein